LQWAYSLARDWLVGPTLGWLGEFYHQMFVDGCAVALEACLAVFFAPDHLRGEDMYSCDHCKKSVGWLLSHFLLVFYA
jgi:hypothetical protein